MIFINATESIGQIIAAGTTSVTGSILATLFMVLLVLLVISLMFGIPLEFTAVLLLPFCIGVGAYYGAFVIPIAFICIFVAALIAKNWLFR